MGQWSGDFDPRITLHQLWLIGIVFLAGISIAMAHSDPPEIAPADGSVLTVAPEEIQFSFPEAVRLTAVRLYDAGDEEVVLPGKRDMKAAKERRIGLPALPEGQYRVEWRALSGDGHPVSGSFSFTVLSSD